MSQRSITLQLGARGQWQCPRASLFLPAVRAGVPSVHVPLAVSTTMCTQLRDEC